MHRQPAGDRHCARTGAPHLGSDETQVRVVFAVKEFIGKELAIELAIGGFDGGDRYLYLQLARHCA